MERGRSIIPLFSAWDRAFYSLTKAYLKVKLKSGSEIFGCIDSSAYISDGRRNEPDIWFSLYYVSDSGKWIKQDNESILISTITSRSLHLLIEAKGGEEWRKNHQM